jgi:signal transduction histidine kinase
VILITHDVEEVFDVADRVVVLQRGKLIFDGPIAKVTRLELLRLMSGRGRVEAERILAAVSTERKRIERDLHDGAQQQLVNAALMLQLATDKLRDSSNEQVTGLLSTSVEKLHAALSELRDLSRGIYPVLLGEYGLVPAVESLARRSAVPVELDARDVPRVGEQVELAAYFVVAEALTNALKHARADQVLVTISHDGGELHVKVSDDGVGAVDESAGTGIQGLRERVAGAGGRISVASAPGEGTTLIASFPAVAEVPA